MSGKLRVWLDNGKKPRISGLADEITFWLPNGDDDIFCMTVARSREHHDQTILIDLPVGVTAEVDQRLLTRTGKVRLKIKRPSITKENK